MKSVMFTKLELCASDVSPDEKQIVDIKMLIRFLFYSY